MDIVHSLQPSSSPSSATLSSPSSPSSPLIANSYSEKTLSLARSLVDLVGGPSLYTGMYPADVAKVGLPPSLSLSFPNLRQSLSVLPISFSFSSPLFIHLFSVPVRCPPSLSLVLSSSLLLSPHLISSLPLYHHLEWRSLLTTALR